MARQEQALRDANDALTQSNADLQQFAYSASHDLQEPLRMVATYSEMLKKKFGEKLGPSGDEYIGYAIQGASANGTAPEGSSVLYAGLDQRTGAN